MSLKLSDTQVYEPQLRGQDRAEAARREAGPPNYHDDKVGSVQQVVNKSLSLSGQDRAEAAPPPFPTAAGARVRARPSSSLSLQVLEGP